MKKNGMEKDMINTIFYKIIEPTLTKIEGTLII